MAKQNTKSAHDIRNLFDPQGYKGVIHTWANMNERMATIAVEAATRATDIAGETTKQALANVRDLTQARDELSEYGKAYMDFFHQQTELFSRSAQTYAAETQRVGAEAGDLVANARDEMAAKTTAAVESAAQTAHSMASNAS